MFSGIPAPLGRRGPLNGETVKLDPKTHLTNRFKKITEDCQAKKNNNLNIIFHSFMKEKKSKTMILVLFVFLLDVLVAESRMSGSVGPECVDTDTHRSGSLR